MKYLSLFLLLICGLELPAAQENLKGLLPEVKLNSQNEDANQEKSFQSEILITKSENKAIETLTKIIKKNAGNKEEADLMFRLAELYMRRAKSGRFFDLDLRSENRLKQIGLQNQKATDSLKQALKIYEQISARFPNFKDLDYVLFNSALAHLQLKQTERAKTLYAQLINKFPNSVLIPDALLDYGETLYNQHIFTTALEKFKALQKFPESRAYPYGIYKSAWCYYNLKNAEEGIQQLLIVVKQNPADSKDEKKYNLRREALRDLTLFVGESLAPNQVFGFFQKITTEAELGEIIMALAGLYESHSRFKEISVFTREFINNYPSSPHTPKCYTKLIETNETLKLRPAVIDTLTEMSEFCRKNKADATCLPEFRKVSLDISKKWWDIWLKNKTHTEFSQLTEKAFENLLSLEAKDAPDSKSRYAYAELLFQMGKFEKASQNYEIVSLQKKLDPTATHDALYGALFSIEKQLEKQEQPETVERQKLLGQRYIKEFTNGEHKFHIQYKLGFIAYKQADYDLALSYITPLLKIANYDALKTKSEDLVLDIYNIKKDYVTIQSAAKDILKRTNITAREENLKKIIEEAHYSQIQQESKDLPQLKQIELLVTFSKSHLNTKLGREAYWQGVSMAFSKGFDVLGANHSIGFIAQYPDDKRKLDALKEATKAYLDSGDLKLGIKTLKQLAELDTENKTKHNDLICDLLKINGQIIESRNCLKDLFNKVDKTKKAAILARMIKTFENPSGPEYLEIQNQIMSLNIEPFATEILIAQAKKLLLSKKYKEAFAMSLKINGRPVDETFRAEARLIQAAILESEFQSQSVKAQESKLALVISMKTEKLDKAFTAYSSAIKMSKSDKIQLQGLQGIDRLYAHFIESISNITLPDTLNTDDKTALKAELAKLTAPFADKRKSNSEQIRNISKLATTKIQDIDWDEFNVAKTVEPQIRYPDKKKLNQYFLQDAASPEMKSLLNAKKFAEAEKLALNLTSTRENRFAGLYFLSLVADAHQEYEKSLWLLEKAGAIKAHPFVDYQRAKVLYSVEDLNSAFGFFEKVLDIKDSTPEVAVFTAIKAFSEGDYLKANEEFSRLTAEHIYNYGVDIIHIDSTLLKGDSEKAQKLAEKYSSFKADRVEMYLEQARIFEHFAVNVANNRDNAISFYEKALAKSNNPQQKSWISRKITYLKNNKNNQTLSYVGGKL